MKGAVPKGHRASGVGSDCLARSQVSGKAARGSSRTAPACPRHPDQSCEGWTFWARAAFLPFPAALSCCEEAARSWPWNLGWLLTRGGRQAGER